MKNIDSLNQSRQESRPPQITSTTIKHTGGDPRQASLLAGGQKRGRLWLKLALTAIAAIIIFLAGLVLVRATNLSDKIFVGKKTSFFSKIYAVFGGGAPLEGESGGQINILLLGIGGEGHDGPYLTDTIIAAQIRPDLGEISLTSIPRDYWTAMPKGDYYAKINNAFSAGYTKNKNWNEGGQWARQAAQNLTGLSIPYFAVVDFAGFEKAVDKIGGLDVNVERSFTDYSFPNDKTYGYLPPVTFEAGERHFNGQQALIFARSRHAAGLEGSDFARSQRQQKIIEAFKEKLLKLNIIGDAGKINDLLEIFADHFHTNLTPGEILRAYNLSKEKGMRDIISMSLDPDTGLICPQVMEDTGAYVLVPCPGKTAEDIKNFFQNAFTLGRMYQEKPVIWVGNSTKDQMLYRQADSRLKEAGLTVWEVPYATDGAEAFSQTIFYQVNPKPATAEFLKNSLQAKELTLPPPGLKINKDKVDIIVILGRSPD